MALIAQLAVPKKDPVNEPDVEPITTISSPLEPDLLINANPSCVLIAISPSCKEAVSGTFPGTALLRSFKC